MPTVLVLGGLGFIGRNLVPYLYENNLAEEIRVVDKSILLTANLNPRQKEAFNNVEIKQKDLVDPASIKEVFTREDGSSYDYVFNLAAETKYSQIDAVYEARIYDLSVRNAEEAARRKVKCFVELSTAEVYQADKNPSKEDDKIKPWTTIAKFKYKAEEKLKTIEGLNLVILRPVIVYGEGATVGLVPRIVCGRIYQFSKEEMKFLWSKDLKINTVHVIDVVRAMWHVAKCYEENDKAGKVLIYNLVDQGCTDQDRINKHISNIFKIQTGFYGTIANNILSFNIDNTIDDINDKHMRPWAVLLRKNRIKSTPLSPYLDKELLSNNALSVDGTKIIQETGFKYEVPQITDEKLIEMIEDFKVLGLWPVNDK